MTEHRLLELILSNVEAMRREHREDLGKLEESLGKRLDNHAQRIDSLEQTRDQNSFPRQLVLWATAALVAGLVGAGVTGVLG